MARFFLWISSRSPNFESCSSIFARRFAVATAFSFSSTRFSGSVNSSRRVWMRSSIFKIRSSSRSVTKLIATPPRPARAVRPTRCVYSSGSFGRSQLMTMATSSMSSPRAPTSVDIKTGTTNDLNKAKDDNLSRCVSRECSAVLRIESVFKRFVKNAAVRGRAQNIIVGGGCSGSSSSSVGFFGFFDFGLRDDFAASGGARRR